MTRNVKLCLSLLVLLVLIFTVAVAALAEPLDTPEDSSPAEESQGGESSESSESSEDSSDTSTDEPGANCTVTIEGEHVTVYFDGTPARQHPVPKGTELSFRVVPEDGYRVDSVTLFGVKLTGNNGVYTIRVDDNCTIRISTSPDSGESSDEPAPPSSSEPSSSTPPEESSQPTPTAELHVTIRGTGTVSANGQTIAGTGDAAQTGSITLDVGVPTQVTVSPAYGYRLAELKLDGQARVPTESMTLRITEATALEVTFEPDTIAPTTYQVVISCTTEGGYVSADGQTITSSNAATINVNAGSSLSISVYPSEGYELDAFLVGGVAQNLSGGSYTLENIAANTSVTVSFKEVTTTITPVEASDFTWTADADGLIWLDLKGNSYIGMSVFDRINTLTASDGSYVVLATSYVRWYIPCGGRIDGVTGEYLQLSVATNANGSYYGTIEASIHAQDPDTLFNFYELSAEPSFPTGTEVAFHMLGFASTHVGNGVDLLVRSDRSLKKVGEGTIEADGWTSRMTFQNSRYLVVRIEVVDQYTITASAGEHGRIDPSGSNSVASQSSSSFTITADDGYVIAGLYVDEQPVAGASGGVTYRYTFSSVTGNHTIRVEFEPIVIDPAPENRSHAGLIVALIIAFVAIAGAAALFIVKWRQEKF